MKRVKPKKLPRLRAQSASQKPSKEDIAEGIATLHRYNLFVYHYLKTGGKAEQAAIEAGYSPRSASSQATDLLKVPYIAQRIHRAHEKLQERTGITVEKLIAEYAKMGFASIDDYGRVDEFGDFKIDFSQVTPDQYAAVQEIQTEVVMRGSGDMAFPVKQTKVKLHDKGAALEKIARLLGYLTHHARRPNGEDGDDGPLAETIHYTLNFGGNASVHITQGKDGTVSSEPRTIDVTPRSQAESLKLP